MGQANFPVDPNAHTSPPIAAAAMSGSSGMASIDCAAGPPGSWNSRAGRSAGGVGDPARDRQVARHSPIGSSRTTLEASSGKAELSSAASIPPKDWPTTTGLCRPEVAHDLFVDQDNIGEVVNGMDGVGVPDAGAREFRGVDGVVLGQVRQERIPRQAGRRVQVEQGCAGAGDLDPDR